MAVVGRATRSIEAECLAAPDLRSARDSDTHAPAPRLWLADTVTVHAHPSEEPDMDLDRAYRRLTHQQRAVVALHYEYGYSLDECAALIGCQPGTARSHLARALASLRKEINYG